jgi:hypothetical protein
MLSDFVALTRERDLNLRPFWAGVLEETCAFLAGAAPLLPAVSDSGG